MTGSDREDMSTQTTPGSDAKREENILAVVKLLFGSELLDVKNKIESGMVQMLEMERRLDKKIEERTTPKPIPWFNIAGLTFTASIFVAGIIGAFVMYHISPLAKDVDDLGRKIDRETVAVETRLTALIDAQRRDVQSFKDSTNRDLQWNYANQNLQHEHAKQNLARVWAKVFASDMPTYQPPSRPTQ